MRLGVLVQTAVADEALAADVAREWTLVGVLQHVVVVEAPLLGGVAAGDDARKRLVAGVGADVDAQIAGRGKARDRW